MKRLIRKIKEWIYWNVFHRKTVRINVTMDELRTAFSNEQEYNKFLDKLERQALDAIRN